MRKQNSFTRESAAALENFVLNDGLLKLAEDFRLALEIDEKRDSVLGRTVAFLEMIIAVIDIILASRKNNIFELLGFTIPFGDMVAAIADQIGRTLSMAIDTMLRPLSMSFDIVLNSRSWKLFQQECTQAGMIPDLAFCFATEVSGELNKKIQEWIKGFGENLALWDDIAIKRDEFKWLLSLRGFLSASLSFLQKIGHCFDIENITREMTNGSINNIGNNAANVVDTAQRMNDQGITFIADPIIRSNVMRDELDRGRTLDELRIEREIRTSMSIPEVLGRLRQYRDLRNDPVFTQGNVQDIIKLLPPVTRSILRSSENSMSQAMRGLLSAVEFGPFSGFNNSDIQRIQRILNINENRN
jgi:hypothetical protein